MENGSSGKQGAPSPCAACKLLRRRCAQDCVFAPYFPADEPQKFAIIPKVFGASNVNKMLQELPEHQKGDAVSSMVYEANARVRDPVYGCVGAISSLQQQIDVLQTQMALAQAEVVHLRVRQTASFSNHGTLISIKRIVLQRARMIGCDELAQKFDLKVVRALAFVLMECVKDKVKNLSPPESAAFVGSCSLLKHNLGNILSLEEIMACIGIDSRKGPIKRIPHKETTRNQKKQKTEASEL